MFCHLYNWGFHLWQLGLLKMYFTHSWVVCSGGFCRSDKCRYIEIQIYRRVYKRKNIYIYIHIIYIYIYLYIYIWVYGQGKPGILSISMCFLLRDETEIKAIPPYHLQGRPNVDVYNGPEPVVVSRVRNPINTLAKFNIAPEKRWLEGYFPIGKVTFQGLC